MFAALEVAKELGAGQARDDGGAGFGGAVFVEGDSGLVGGCNKESAIKTESAERPLDRFLDAFTPEIAELARKGLVKMRKRLPHAIEMVYDNYNALACGFGPSEQVSHAIFSIAVYPTHNFVFSAGSEAAGPEGLLQGEGSVVRHIRLEDEKTLDRADVKAMMATAMQDGQGAV